MLTSIYIFVSYLIGIPKVVTKNELCGRYPSLDRYKLNHEKKNIAINCNPAGLGGKYLTITSHFQTSRPEHKGLIPWSINEIIVQASSTVQEYSDVYGGCMINNFQN